MATKDYYKGVTVQYKGDDSKLSAVLTKMNSEMRQSQGAARALDAALKWDGKNVNLIIDRIKVCHKQIETTEERVKALKSALETAEDPEVIERLTTQSIRAETKLKELQDQLEKLTKQAVLSSGSDFSGFAAGITQFGESLQSVGGSMREFGDTATMHLTAPIVAFSAATIDAATTIDSALTDVRKTVDGTEEQYQALKDAAIEYSKTNGVTAEQVLEVQALGAQLGYARDELEMIGRVGSGLDIATDMNAEKATTDMAQFANITGMAHDQTENYASTIVALGNNTATTESKISDMAQRIAAAGSQVGMSQSEILGLSAALSSVGMEAEAGGTAISTIMSNIDKDVATNSDRVADWAATAGMSAKQFADEWRSNPVHALQEVLAGMQDATEAGGNMSVILEDLGVKSIRQTDALKRLAGNSDLVRETVTLANQAWEENTALSEEVANKNDSLAAKMQMLQNRITAVMEQIGKPLADALLDIMDAAQPLFDAIESGAQAFADMDEGQQKLIVTAGLLAAAIGPVSSVMGRIIEDTGSVISAFGSAAEGFVTFKTALGEGFSVMESLELASDGLAVTITGGLQAGLVGLAAVVAGSLIQSFADYHTHLELVHDATDGLAEASDEAVAAFDNISDAADTTIASADSIRASLNDALSDIASFGDTISDTMSELASNGALLDEYGKTIEELASKSTLTQGEQEKLKDAVSRYNGIADTNIEVLDAQAGKLSVLPSKINEVTEAYKKQAEMTAYADLYAEAIKKQAKAEEELKQTNEDLAAATKKMQENYSSHAIDLENMPAKVQALKQKSEELGAAQEALAGRVEYFSGKMDEAASSAGNYERKLSDLSGASIGAVSDITSVSDAQDKVADSAADMAAATEAATTAMKRAHEDAYTALQRALEQEYEAQRAAYDAEYDALKEALQAEYDARKSALDQELTAITEALQAEYDARKSALEKELSALSDALAKQVEKRKAAQAKELSDRRATYAQQLSDLKKQHSAEEAAIKSANDKKYKQRKSALDKELKLIQSENDRALKQQKAAAAEETKAFKAATKERIAAIKEEYETRKKYLEQNDGRGDIDAKIKLLENENKAEQDAAKRATQEEKKAELQKAVDQAKSRRKRAEAEEELNKYLAQLAQEAREEERNEEIARLQERKDQIVEETKAKQDALDTERDARISAYESQRDEELTALEERQDAIYQALDAKLTEQEDLRKSHNETQLEQYRAQLDAMLTAASEANDAEEEQMAAQHEAKLTKLAERQTAELDALRAHNEAIVASREEQNTAELEAIEKQNEAIIASKKTQNENELAALSKYNETELQTLKDAQTQALTDLKNANADRLTELKRAQEDELAALEASLSAASASVDTKGEEIKQKGEGHATDLKVRLKRTLAVLPEDMEKLAAKSGHSFSQGIESKRGTVKSSAKNLNDDVMGEVNGMPSAAQTLGTDFSVNIAGGISGKKGDVESAAKESVYDPVMNSVSTLPSDLSGKGDESLSDYISAVNGKKTEVENTAKETLTDVLNDAATIDISEKGRDAASGFAGGINDSSSQVSTAADGLKNDVTNTLDDAQNWTHASGYNAGVNFADGLSSAYSWVANAASNIADAVSRYLHHSTPEVGPLSDDDEWGGHLVDNLTGGMRSREGALARQASRLATLVADNYDPQLSTRFDANLNYAADYARVAQAGAFGTQAFGPTQIHVAIDMHDVRLDGSTDIRATARALAYETARELDASLVA